MGSHCAFEDMTQGILGTCLAGCDLLGGGEDTCRTGYVCINADNDPFGELECVPSAQPCDEDRFCGPNDADCDADSLCAECTKDDDCARFPTRTACVAGFCRVPCEPFVDTCAAGEWCAPDPYVEGSGGCFDDPGELHAGQICDDTTPATTCSGGLLCLERLSDAVCRSLCYPSALEGAPGDTCGADESCWTLADSEGGPTVVGVCHPSCDFHAPTPCTDNVLTMCYMGEVFGLEFDPCLTPIDILDPGDVCPDTDYALGELCGPNSACLLEPGTADPLYCTDLCIDVNDCRDADNGAMCIDGPGTPDICSLVFP